MINNANNPKLKFIYKDKLGNNWYGYQNPLDIDAVRGIESQTADRYVGMMISQDELTLALDSMVTAAKENNFLKVGSIVYDLKFRNKFLCETNSLLDLAGIYFMLENEDPVSYLDTFKLKKQQIWQDDKDCRAFFLSLGLTLTKQLANIPEGDLIASLEKTLEVAERIYRHIPRPLER